MSATGVSLAAGVRPVLPLLALVAAALLLTGAPAGAQQATSVTLSGTVSNGTAGGALPPNLPVRLVVIRPAADMITGTEVERREAAIDDEGRFAFEDVSVGDGFVCRMVALAQNYTPVVDVRPCETRADLELTIWDSTDSLDDVSLGIYRVVVPAVSAADESLLFLTSAEVVNAGDRIWAPEGPNPTGLDLLRFNIPEGYFELNVEEGIVPGVAEGILGTIRTGFALSTPIPPGAEYTVLASYGVPYEGSEIVLPFRLPHGAERFQFHLQSRHGTVSSSALSYTGVVTIADEEYALFEGFDLPKGTQLDLRVTGLPQPGFGDRLSDFLTGTGYIWFIAGGVGLCLIALAVYAFIRWRKHRSDEQNFWEI